jgi:hypothetical protein
MARIGKRINREPSSSLSRAVSPARGPVWPSLPPPLFPSCCGLARRGPAALLPLALGRSAWRGPAWRAAVPRSPPRFGPLGSPLGAAQPPLRVGATCASGWCGRVVLGRRLCARDPPGSRGKPPPVHPLQSRSVRFSLTSRSLPFLPRARARSPPQRSSS